MNSKYIFKFFNVLKYFKLTIVTNLLIVIIKLNALIF